jgi:CheY-like chemotaxis protein
MKKPAINVLMVEDLHLAQIVAIRIFESLNCQVHIVSSAAKALEQLLIFHYDIIFIDIQLPDINGLTLAQTMRSLERRGTHMPLIAVTAYKRDDIEESAKNAGFDDFVFKPLTVDVVQSLFKKHLPPKSTHARQRA